MAFPTVRRGLAFALGSIFLLYLLFLLLIVPATDSFLLSWILPSAKALISLMFFRRAFDTRPSLVLSSRGIVDRTSIVGGELLIPWNEVRGIEISPILQVLEVTVRDLDRIRKNTGWIRRIWMLLGRPLGKNKISVNPMMFSLKVGELKDQMEAALFNHERVRLGFPSETSRLGDVHAES